MIITLSSTQTNFIRPRVSFEITGRSQRQTFLMLRRDLIFLPVHQTAFIMRTHSTGAAKVGSRGEVFITVNKPNISAEESCEIEMKGGDYSPKLENNFAFCLLSEDEEITRNKEPEPNL